MIKEELRTDMYYFKKNGEKAVVKNCLLLNNFYFSRNDFYLMDVGGVYEVCVSRNNELYAIWAAGKENTTPSEAMSRFRKGYTDNIISTEKIEKFLDNPKKYGKKVGN